MPNWIRNSLFVCNRPQTYSSTTEYERSLQVKKSLSPELTRFMALAEGREKLSLNSIAPLPDVSDRLHHYVVAATWGCERDADEVDRKVGDNRVDYDFVTPRSPPLRALLSVSKRFPSLEFHLQWIDYGGHTSGGEFVICDGDFLFDQTTPQICYEFVTVDVCRQIVAKGIESQRKRIEKDKKLSDADKATLFEVLGLNPSLGDSHE